MTVLTRAVVMLVVLVGLPAAWVYYGPLPPSAQSLVDRLVEVAKEALSWEDKANVGEQIISAPRFNVATEPLPTTSVGSMGLTTDASVQAAKGTDTRQVEKLLGRLRTLGVAEYTLEKWGNAGRLYRFCCAMPLAQSDQITRQFEAVAASPISSIKQVVAEVSNWHTSRSSQQRIQ